MKELIYRPTGENNVRRGKSMKGGSMKKIAVFLIAIAFMLASAPSFAQTAAAPAKERNLFKIIGNSLKGPLNLKSKDQLKPINLKQNTVFQKVADDIGKVDKKTK